MVIPLGLMMPGNGVAPLGEVPADKCVNRESEQGKVAKVPSKSTQIVGGITRMLVKL